MSTSALHLASHPFHSSLRTATVPALLGAALSLGGLGCNAQGQARNPTFTAATAPDPAVVIAPISCRSEYAGGSGDRTQSQFKLLVKSQLGVKPVELDKEQQMAVCASVAGYRDGVKDWQARATLLAIVREVAQNEHAQSVLVPVAKYTTQCKNDQSVIKDADGRTIASVDRGTQTCQEGGPSLNALLFSANGSLLWKSWGNVRGGSAAPGMFAGAVQVAGSSPDVENSITALLANIPAKFVDASGGKAAASASADAAPSPAKQDAATDDAPAIAGAPECKQLAKVMCDRSAGTPAHAQLCAGYARSYGALASSPQGANVCRAQLAAVQPHG